jgi:hypothetical protein
MLEAGEALNVVMTGVGFLSVGALSNSRWNPVWTGIECDF